MASKVIEPDISDVGLVRLKPTKFKTMIFNPKKRIRLQKTKTDKSRRLKIREEPCKYWVLDTTSLDVLMVRRPDSQIKTNNMKFK